jgi:membrane protein DedA with SNARE-associated domain
MTDAVDLDRLDGLVGIAARTLDRLGEVGVGLLTFVETVFPPIPSEIILPLAGFLAAAGTMSLPLVILAATLGSYAGALVLYVLGRRFGHERAVRWLSRLPLVDADDFEKAAAWFRRHGRSAVLFGRLVPGVRSLISLPAGSERMPLLPFSLFTILGSAVWNTLLIGLGAALGSQYETVEHWSGYLDYVVYAAVAGLLAWLVVRRIRRHRAGRTMTPDAE